MARQISIQAFFASQNVDVTHGSGSGEELKNVKNEYRSKLTNQNLNACMDVGLEERLVHFHLKNLFKHAV